MPIPVKTIKKLSLEVWFAGREKNVQKKIVEFLMDNKEYSYTAKEIHDSCMEPYEKKKQDISWRYQTTYNHLRRLTTRGLIQKKGSYYWWEGKK